MTEPQKPEIIELPKICDPRGNLSVIEGLNNIPFDIKRTYWIYDVPGGQLRNGHAFKEQDELIVALSGSFDIVLNNGIEDKRYHMARSYYGLYVPRLTWRSIDNFSTNSVALVLSSTIYNPDDYIEDFDSYKKYLDNAK
ncbi:MAG: FdtA/QdtA family cupin domain-containing protein [Muribaculaceae bacterium]|nr:FdtA/QdtA family cupin domain-containing protein [Muribaculaceae bacterium]